MAIPAQLPRICTCIGYASEAAASDAALASCARGETLLEVRIDMLDDPSKGRAIVRRVRDEYPAAMILATCRRQAGGGLLEGSIEDQVRLLRSAVEAGAEMVDVEIESIEEDPGALDAFLGKTATVASYHNFEETPDLGPVMRRLRATGADILKVATRVSRPSDNLRLLDLCRTHANIVVAGMGETGAPARLLSPQCGGLFTYASPDAPLGTEGSTSGAAATAPGQFAASSVRQLYRVQDRSPGTRVFAVIAKPVGHSMSPLVHNRAFEATGFDGIYVPLLVEPEHLADFFESLRAMPVSGASVTIPHKQEAIRYLDEIDAAAEGIGAVNTVYWNRGRVCGTNTDAAGIAEPLSRRRRIEGSRALVVGNGGAAKAAVVALRRRGATVSVTGRDPGRVARMAGLHGVEAVPFDALGDRYFDVLVQSTPVGMTPDVQGNLFPDRIPADVVFDLVYNPLETALLRRARDQRKVAISGIEMFVEQAAAQFRIWTGLDAPRDVMRDAVLERTVR